MNCEVVRMNENSWRIEDNGVRLFLLTGTEKAMLIDTGMNTHNVRDIAAELTSLPLSRDHIGNNEQFESFYMHPAEEPVYHRSGKPGTIIPVVEGDTIDLGGRELKIIELPGHTPGSIAVLDVKGRILISGDPIQEDGRIFMFGDHRNMDDYIRSLEQLAEQKNTFDEIWPSHANIPVSPEMIEKLHDGARDFLAGKVQGKPTDFHGNRIIVYDLGFDIILCNK